MAMQDANYWTPEAIDARHDALMAKMAETRALLNEIDHGLFNLDSLIDHLQQKRDVSYCARIILEAELAEQEDDLHRLNERNLQIAIEQYYAGQFADVNGMDVM
jgi:hypothetical protein